MTKLAALLLVLSAATPAFAQSWQTYGDYYPPQDFQRITCETVRTFVAQYGLEQARQMARDRGMTDRQEHRAMQCLAQR